MMYLPGAAVSGPQVAARDLYIRILGELPVAKLALGNTLQVRAGLSTFVPLDQIDPLYFETPFYVYPDGESAIDAFAVIVMAMADSRTAGLGRVVLHRRERIVLLEPRSTGMILFTLRTADEVQEPAFPAVDHGLNPEMTAIARAIIQRRTGAFDPSTFRDPRAEALRQLAEAKVQGRPPTPPPKPEPEPDPT